ncbi:MAG: DUF2975 domain-containing protein [Clostridia bacterium]|nr:DUF2975 domain-containing protein [Clostridia bacterium]
MINGGITFTLLESASAAVNFRPVLAAAMASGLVVCAVMAYALKQIHGILAPMKEGAPFSASVGTRFSRLGWFTVIAGIALNIFNAIGKTLLVKILAPMLDGVTQVSVQHSFSLNFIIIAFLLFLLSYVFRYGAELQRLSDETL